MALHTDEIREGDVKINDNWYRINVTSYKSTDIIDFAPRASTPGGSIVHSELGLYQSILQTGWSHGFGFHWHEDATGYLKTVGQVDTRHPGLAMLFTSSTASEEPGYAIEGFTTWNNAVWAWGNGGLRKYSSGAWAAIATFNSKNVLAVLPAGDYLFVSVDGERLRKVATNDTVTDAGVDENATDYKWLIIHEGYIYAGKDGSSFIHYDSESSLSLLEGDSTDTNRIALGASDIPTIDAAAFASKLFVTRQDGLWHVGADNIGRRVIDFTKEISTNNFRSIIEHLGFLIFAVRDVVYQWNGARLSDITPSRLSEAFPYVTYGRFDNFVVADDFFFCTARTNETTYTESLLCFDGVAWHQLDDLITDGTGSISGMGYDAINNYLWYCKDLSTDATFYIPFQAESKFPFADFPTTKTHSLYSSRIAAGFRRVKKSFVRLDVEADNVDDGTYLKIYYSLDGAAFVEWDDAKINGVNTLLGPGGDTTKEFYYMTIRVDFITNDSTQSPILEGLTLKFIMRAEEAYGYSFNIPASNGYMYGQYMDTRSPNQIINELKEARASEAPVKYLDLWGQESLVYISALNITAIERHSTEDTEGESNVEAIVGVNLVEADVT